MHYTKVVSISIFYQLVIILTQQLTVRTQVVLLMCKYCYSKQQFLFADSNMVFDNILSDDQFFNNQTKRFSISLQNTSLIKNAHHSYLYIGE